MIIGNVQSERPASLPPYDAYTNIAGVTIDVWNLLAQAGGASEVTNYTAALAGGASINYVAIVGAYPVMITRRSVMFDGLGLLLELFSTPTYTGGTPLVSYNMNAGFNTPVLSSLLGGATITTPGTKVASDITVLGNVTVGQTVVSTSLLNTDAIPHILMPNTTYLFRTTSLDTNAMRVSTHTQFFEGMSDSIVFE